MARKKKIRVYGRVQPDGRVVPHENTRRRKTDRRRGDFPAINVAGSEGFVLRDAASFLGPDRVAAMRKNPKPSNREKVRGFSGKNVETKLTTQPEVDGLKAHLATTNRRGKTNIPRRLQNFGRATVAMSPPPPPRRRKRKIKPRVPRR